MRISNKTIFTALLATVAATPAFADDQAPSDPKPDTGKTAPPTPDSQLPPSESSHDTQPPVASPSVTLPPGGVVEQAGVGGAVAYGRPGVLELGGSAGLMLAPDFRNVNVSPSVGWFLADNLELSAIFGVSNIKAGNESSTILSAIAEPSYHLPINRTTFAFLGMGFGYAHIKSLGGGLAVAPRIGANFLVGRSGILSPSLSYEYTTHDVQTTPIGDQQDVTLLAVSNTLRINIGYTAMW